MATYKVLIATYNTNKATYLSSDLITIFDTGANIAALNTTALTNLIADKKIKAIQASDGSISLTKAQEIVIDRLLLATDKVTIADTGANIASMTVAQLSSTKIDVIDASDTNISLTVAKELAADSKLVTTDVITVADTGTAIAAMTVAQLSSTKIDVIDASNNAISLTVAQELAADSKLVTADVITVADTGGAIAAKSATQLGSSKIDVIDATNNAISLTVAQELATDSKLVAADVITIADTGAAIAAMTAAQLGSAKIDVVDASDNVLTLTVAKELAADSKLVTADTIKVADTGAAIAAMTAAQLGSAKIDIIDATSAFSLTVAQELAADSKLVTGDDITVRDTGANISKMNATQLGSSKIDIIDISDSVSFSVAQELSADSKLLIGSTISIADTGVSIAKMTATQLGSDKIDIIDASNNAITLTVAQEVAADNKLLIADVITVTDTGANISGMTAAQLGSTKVDIIKTATTDSTHAITLTVDKALAADSKLVTTDVITVADTGTNIASMTATQLGSSKIDIIDATSAFSLTVAQELAADSKLVTADAITVADTSTAIAAMTAAQLGSAKIDVIDTNDDLLTLTVAKELAADSKLVTDDTITVLDTGTAIAAMTAAQLGSSKIDIIDASNNALTLTVAQETAADSKLVETDIITVADTGIKINSMAATKLGSSKIDIIDATNNAISLTVDQELAADSKLVIADVITVADTGAAITAMTAAQLGSSKIDIIDASDNALTLTVAQQLATDSKLVTGDAITVSDTGEMIGSMTVAQLGSKKIDTIDANDDDVTLTIAQELIADAKLATTDNITVSDTGAHIAAMTVTQLGSSKIDIIDATDDLLTLNIAQEIAADGKLVTEDTITIIDTGANIAKMTATQLGSAKIDIIDASDNILILTADQEIAADDKFVVSDRITIIDTGAHIGAMTATQLGSSKIDVIDASGTGQIDLTVDQELAADAKLVTGDTISLKDSGANIANMNAAQLGSIKIDTIDASTSISLTVAQELASDSKLVVANDITLADTGLNIASMTAVQLASTKIDHIDAYDDVLTLTASQARAASSMLTAADIITLVDKGVNIATMTSTEISNNKIDIIDASDDAISLTAAQEIAADSKLVDNDTITVLDTGANITAKSATELGSSKIDIIDASNNILSLSVDQEIAADSKLVTGDKVTISDTASNIQAMTAEQLASTKIDLIDANDDLINLSVTQELAANSKLDKSATSDEITLSDTGENIASMRADQISSIQIKTIDASDDKIVLTDDQILALLDGTSGRPVLDVSDFLTYQMTAANVEFNLGDIYGPSPTLGAGQETVLYTDNSQAGTVSFADVGSSGNFNDGDTFSATHGIDVITQFTTSIDKIDLTAFSGLHASTGSEFIADGSNIFNGTYKFIQGDWDSGTSVFTTATSSGADTLLVWDGETTEGIATDAVVLIGVTGLTATDLSL